MSDPLCRIGFLQEWGQSQGKTLQRHSNELMAAFLPEGTSRLSRRMCQQGHAISDLLCLKTYTVVSHALRENTIQHKNMVLLNSKSAAHGILKVPVTFLQSI